MLVVLVAYQTLVEIAEALETPAWPAAKINCIDSAFVIHVARARTTHNPAVLEGGSDGPLHRSAAHRDPRTTDVVGPAALEGGEALREIVLGIGRVHIEARDHLTAGTRQASVQARRYDAPRVIDDDQACIDAGARIEPLARTVIAGAIGDQPLSVPALRQPLRDKCIEERANTRPLIATGDDDRE